MKLTEDTTVRYYTKIEERRGGPYTREGLESLVYLQKITPDTLISREDSETFAPVIETELGPVLFKQMLQQQIPGNWVPPGEENNPAYLHRTRHRLSEARFEKLNAPTEHQSKIDVLDLLDGIRQSEIESGHDYLRSRRWRFSKRSRDFWIMLIGGNTLILGGALCFQNVASMVFGIAGSGLFTFGLLWSMFGVMDNY